MKYVIITENDESQWDDKTGLSYNYPSKYRRILTPGTRAIYYKGKLRNKSFENTRLSNEPHYFGVALIGDHYLDKSASKKEYHCDILNYQPFESAVPFRVNGEYIESIPESKKSNYWRDGVREVTKETFDKILELASTAIEPAIERSRFRISQRKFAEVFNKLPEFVKDMFEGQEFIGFGDGFLHEMESYKDDLRRESLTILKTTEWEKDWVGKGKIIARVIQSFELEDNNLVGTRRRFGPDSVPHRKMLNANRDGTNLVIIEQVLFNLFKTSIEAEYIFEQLVELIGKQYSVIAFLFYLKDNRQYVPISTTSFEHAFRTLGCDLPLARRCSWKNYRFYLNVINQVKSALEFSMNQNVNLIDAHSFCWLLGYNNQYQDWVTEKSLPITKPVFNAYVIRPVNDSSNLRRSIPNERNREVHVDWDKENQKKRIRGRRAEELVIDFECQRLQEAGKQDLAAKVEDYSNRYSKGFDVLSWNEDGTERNIEVKSSSSNSFIITRNELRKSKENPNYWIYIVNEKKDEVQIKQIKTPALEDESQFRLEPKDYYVTFSINE